MKCSRLLVRAVGVSVLFGLVVAVFPVRAEEFCADTPSEIAAAMATAATNGQDDLIRIAAGNYDVSGVTLEHRPATIAGGDDKDLTIIGGWHEFFGNPCGQLLVQDPLQTTLTSLDMHRVMAIDVRESSAVKIALLTFFDGNAGSGAGGGLEINALDVSVGALTVENNVFFSNTARYGGGLSIASRPGGFGRINVLNNVFVANHSTADGNISAVNLANLDDHGFGASRGIYFANNTVLGNVAETSESYACTVQLYGAVGRFVYNNNLWSNGGADDLRVYAPANDQHDYKLIANNFESAFGTPTVSNGNLSVVPVFQPPAHTLDFRLVVESPLVDAGIAPGPPPNGVYWHLTEFDALGLDRVVGSAVDIGAYETEIIFRNGFDPGTM